MDKQNRNDALVTLSMRAQLRASEPPKPRNCEKCKATLTPNGLCFRCDDTKGAI